MSEGTSEIQGQQASKAHEGIEEPTVTEPVTSVETAEPRIAAEADQPQVEPDKTETKEGKTPRRFGRYIIAAASGVAIIGAGVFVYNLGRDSGKPNANGAPDANAKDKQTSAVATPIASQTAEVSPSPTESLNEAGQLSVPEISSALTPNAIGKAVVQDALLNWRDAGITDTIVQDQQASGLSPEGYADATASKWATAYENALLVDNWQGYQDVKAYADQLQAANAQNILLRIETANDQYPFAWSSNLATSTEQVTDEGSGTQQVNLHVIFNDGNNATQNSAMNIDPSVVDNTLGVKRINVKLVKVGNAMKISSITEFDVK